MLDRINPEKPIVETELVIGTNWRFLLGIIIIGFSLAYLAWALYP